VDKKNDCVFSFDQNYLFLDFRIAWLDCCICYRVGTIGYLVHIVVFATFCLYLGKFESWGFSRNSSIYNVYSLEYFLENFIFFIYAGMWGIDVFYLFYIFLS